MDTDATLNSSVASPSNWISSMIIGAIVGIVARLLMGATRRPFWEDMLLGLVGSVTGGFIFRILGLGHPKVGGSAVAKSLAATIASGVSLVWLGRAIRGRM